MGLTRLLASATGFCSKEAWFSHLAPGPQMHTAGPQLLGPKGGAYTGSNLQLTRLHWTWALHQSCLQGFV